MANIYIDLILPIDGADTNPATLITEINKRVAYWQRGLAQFPEYQTHLNNAKMYLLQIQQGTIDLPKQAGEARRIQLQNLQQYVLDAKRQGSDTEHAKQAAKEHFRGFADETFDWAFANAPLEPFANFREIKGTAAPDNFVRKLKTIGVIAAGIAVLFVAYSVYSVLASFFSAAVGVVSVSSSEGTVSSDKGTVSRSKSPASSSKNTDSSGNGPDIVRYPNRDYSKAEWKDLKYPSDYYEYREYIAAAVDKNHFVICGHCLGGLCDNGYAFNNGSWTEIQTPSQVGLREFYRGIFITNENDIGTFNSNSWQMKKLPEKFTAGSFITCEKDVVYIGSADRPNQGVIYSGGNITELKEDDRRLFVWDGNKNLGSIFGMCAYRTYGNGRAIGLHNGGDRREVNWHNNMKIVKYATSTGWIPHLLTTRRGHTLTVWALDENNFVLAGDGITIFKNGEETHPIVNCPEFPPNQQFRQNECCEVWGTDIDHFWVIDSYGNIVEYKNGTFAKAKSGNGVFNIHSYWISPDGAVITGSGWILD